MDAKKHSKKRSKANSESEEDETFLPEQQNCRFYVISGENENSSLSALSPFVLGKALYSEIGTLKLIRKMPKGDILVETDSRVYADKLQRLTELGGVPVKVTPHRTLNTCKGVIRSRDVAACSVEEIVGELGPQGVTDALVISVKDGNASEERIQSS